MTYTKFWLVGNRHFSTHILTRRMTITVFGQINTMMNFQLTSSQGGWQVLCNPWLYWKIFNSHPHKEDDHCVHLLNRWKIFSTHILTRRMTLTLCHQHYTYNLFNSHPHKEDDYNRFTMETEIKIFNSHPHKEDDVMPVAYSSGTKVFNSHPHKEDDAEAKERIGMIMFSTHILTRRMTVMDKTNIVFVNFFNSHPHKEDDEPYTGRGKQGVIFQLTSSQGGWHLSERS